MFRPLLRLLPRAPHAFLPSVSQRGCARSFSGLGGERFDILANRANVTIDGYVPSEGFIVTDPNNNGASVDCLSSIITTPSNVFLWRGPDSAISDFDPTARKYAYDFYKPLLTILKTQPPSPDHITLLLVGVSGQRLLKTPTGHIPQEVLDEIKDVAPDTPVEIMETTNAVATFNVLVGEGRNVMAALLV